MGVRASRLTRRLVVATLTAAWMAAVVPITAHASIADLQTGVHVDPGSPAGKEYQFPVTGARSEAAGGGQASGSAAPPLFGVGVTPATAVAGSTRQTRSHRGTSPAPDGGARPGAHPGGSASSTGSAGPISVAGGPGVAATGSGGAGDSGWVPLAIGGLLVLVLGGGGGLMLRQRVLRG
jgi:hypothetical protein